MALKKFEEYAKEFISDKKIDIDTSFKKIGSDKNIKEKRTIKDLKSPIPPVLKNNTKKINENSFLVGDEYKVKVVVDIPKSLVQEYIDKVKEETDKNPLDNFSEAEIAEQIVNFIVKKNLLIDNLTPDFTVGTENIGSSDKSKSDAENDADELTSDLGDGSDEEIEFKDFDDDKDVIKGDEESDGEIEFSDEPQKKDLGEKRDIDKEESEPDSNFDEIEFEDGDESEKNTKTVGDFKKSQSKKTTEEEEINDLYKKIGYKVGYYENINFNNLKKY